MCRTKDKEYLLQAKKTTEEKIKSLGIELQKLREDNLVVDTADRGNIVGEIERINAERQREIKKLEGINFSLSNISPKVRCEDCGHLIPEKRMKEQPDARCCTPCQSIRDLKGKTGVLRPAYSLSPR